MTSGVSRLRRLVSVLIIITIFTTMCVIGSITASASSTGTGLASWALNAYNNNWSYVYGGTSQGAVDCSGLIYTYNGVGGSRVDMLGSSSYSGSVSSGIPNVHGLGLWQPGHVGVYVGGGMAVDARNEYYGVCYESAYGKSWQSWFYVSGVSYPDTGWENYNGNYYYYENSQYITDTSRTIDGVTYYFSSSGASDKAPGDMSSVASDNSSQSGGSSNDSASNNNSSSNSSSSSSSTESTTSKSEDKVTTETASAAPTSYRNGDENDGVSELQQRLQELGYYNGDITGYFGDATEEAHRAFQKAAGVTIDGIAGESDLELLFSDAAPYASSQEEETIPTVSYYANGVYDDYINDIQNKLITLGYLNGKPTGYFGVLTEDAVKLFQKINVLEVTGILDEDTLDVLFGDDAKSNPDPINTQVTQTASQTPLKVSKAAASPLANAEENTTDVILQNNKLSSKALTGLTNDSTFTGVKTSDTSILTTLIWSLVIITLLGGVAFIVYKNEQSKTRAKRAKARAKRYW